MPRTRLLPPLLVIGLILGACGGGDSTAASPSATEQPTSTPTSEPMEAPTPEPTASPSPTPSPEPTATPSPVTGGPPGGFAVAPHAEADALFLDRDTCTNDRDHYEVTFPDDWWTNTEIGKYPACVWFSPTFYEVPDENAVPDEIAIEIVWLDGDRGYLTEPVSHEEVVVGGQPAVRVEVRGTSASTADNRGMSYEYVIRLGPTPEEGPNLLVRTDTDMGGDYELNKAVMDRMMSTMEFFGSTQ